MRDEKLRPDQEPAELGLRLLAAAAEPEDQLSRLDTIEGAADGVVPAAKVLLGYLKSESNHDPLFRSGSRPAVAVVVRVEPGPLGCPLTVPQGFLLRVRHDGHSTNSAIQDQCCDRVPAS